MTFEWRPLRESDAAALAGLLSVVGKAAGHPDEERLRKSFADPGPRWAHQLDVAGFTPDYSYLVYQGAEPLGALLSREQDKDLFIALVGTRAAGRKRGIATALLTRALSRAKADGFATASLEVDSGSLTGAVGVYERAGFTVKSSRMVYAKTLPAGAPR